MSKQQIIIIGNLAKDPEMRYLPSGKAITKIVIAENRKYTNNNSGELVEETTWFNVDVWGKQGEAVNQHRRKGHGVVVFGRMNSDNATGAPRVWKGNDGAMRASNDVTASEVIFTYDNSKPAQPTQAQASPAQQMQQAQADMGVSPPPLDF